jgi:hypothetical protein
VTIEVMAGDETVHGGGRFATDRAGYQALLRYARTWTDRVWAIEGCNGIGHHVAMRLLADGEQVVDVPPKLSARTRVFATGQGRKTDATDAHSVALVGTRMAGLRPVFNDKQLAVLRVLVDRRRALGEDHTRMVAQLHQLLLELIPGGAKKDLSAAQAKALLARVRPRDVVGKTRARSNESAHALIWSTGRSTCVHDSKMRRIAPTGQTWMASSTAPIDSASMSTGLAWAKPQSSKLKWRGATSPQTAYPWHFTGSTRTRIRHSFPGDRLATHALPRSPAAIR